MYFDFVLFSPWTETPCLLRLESQGDFAGTEGWDSSWVGEVRLNLAICLQRLLGPACGPVGQQTWDGTEQDQGARQEKQQGKGAWSYRWARTSWWEASKTSVSLLVCGLWHPSPALLAKKIWGLAQGCQSRCQIKVLPRAFFTSEQPPFPLGKMRIWGLLLWVLRQVCLLQVI